MLTILYMWWIMRIIILYTVVSKLKGIDNIMEVKVRATLKSLSVDLTADSGPLLKAVISGICTCGIIYNTVS